MSTKSLILIVASIAVIDCKHPEDAGKIKIKRKVVKNIRKLSSNTTLTDQQRSFDFPPYGQSDDNQSSFNNLDQDKRSSDLFGFLSGASITSMSKLHFPIPVCQFTDICKLDNNPAQKLKLIKISKL